MGAPWEEYQTAKAAPVEGPWSEYSAPPAVSGKTAPDLGIPNRPGGILQVIGEPIAKAMAPLVDPVNRGLVSLAGGITKGASKIGLIDKKDPIAQAGFDLTPQQLIETHGNQIKDMTGSPWAGAIAKKALEFGPASPGSWVVPAVLAPVAQGVTNAVTGNARSNVAEALAQQSRNAVRDKTIAESVDKGYVIPPSLTGGKSTINEALESFAGKAATKQQAALRNQETTNALVRKELGLPKDAALDPQLLESMRQQAAKPYQDVAALSPNAQSVLEALKDARQNKNLALNEYKRQGTRSAYHDAQRYGQEADLLEKQLELEASRAGQPQLMQDLAAARTTIAKIHDVERALTDQTGNVSAPMLGRELDKMKPLSGELEAIGNFRNAFPQVAQEAEKIPAPGVSHVNSLTSALLGAGGYASMGPGGALLAAAPLARGPVRNLILSKPYQNLMVNPSYAGPMDRALASVGPVHIDPMVAAVLARGVTSQNGAY